MEILRSSNLGLADGGVVAFEVDEVPAHHQDWAEAVAQLSLDELIGRDLSDRLPLALRPDRLASHDQIRGCEGDAERDWWTGDHLWHMDQTTLEMQPVFTLIGCRHADEGAPGTQLLDTVLLNEILDEDGFWKNKGIPEDDPTNLFSIFADSTYYTEALPYIRRMASRADRRRIDARIEAELKKAEVETLDELGMLKNRDDGHVIHKSPLVRHTWLHGFQAIFADGGGRNYRLEDGEGNDFTHVLQKLRWDYLRGDNPERLGIVQRVGWAANRCVMFPQIGALHRAEAGNEHDRYLNLSFLVEVEPSPTDILAA